MHECLWMFNFLTWHYDVKRCFLITSTVWLATQTDPAFVQQNACVWPSFSISKLTAGAFWETFTLPLTNIITNKIFMGILGNLHIHIHYQAIIKKLQTMHIQHYGNNCFKMKYKYRSKIHYAHLYIVHTWSRQAKYKPLHIQIHIVWIICTKSLKMYTYIHKYCCEIYNIEKLFTFPKNSPCKSIILW
jgi:hypothetical protein